VHIDLFVRYVHRFRLISLSKFHVHRLLIYRMDIYISTERKKRNEQISTFTPQCVKVPPVSRTRRNIILLFEEIEFVRSKMVLTQLVDGLLLLLTSTINVAVRTFIDVCLGCSARISGQADEKERKRYGSFWSENPNVTNRFYCLYHIDRVEGYTEKRRLMKKEK
jgi:hypothetical protein